MQAKFEFYKVDTKERLNIALEGGTPDYTPLSFYSWMVADPQLKDFDKLMSDDLCKLYDRGLGICHHCQITRKIEHDVEEKLEIKKQDGNIFEIYRKKTPVGEIQQVKSRGWVVEHWLKTPADYKVMTWIAKNTELVPSYEEYHRVDELIGNRGIVIIWASRTPAMTINVDLAGTERFCMDLANQTPELFELYDALNKLFIRENDVIAKGPGRFVKWFENLTIEVLGPQRYSQLLMPVYQQCVPVLEKNNKKVMVHYDGALRCIAEQISSAPFHIIESLTEPKEGDMMYDECRRLWPNKAFWANINVDLYYMPEKELKDAVAAKRNRAGKKALAFEISEDLPANWKKSVPMVLDTLEELG